MSDWGGGVKTENITPRTGFKLIHIGLWDSVIIITPPRLTDVIPVALMSGNHYANHAYNCPFKEYVTSKLVSGLTVRFLAVSFAWRSF